VCRLLGAACSTQTDLLCGKREHVSKSQLHSKKGNSLNLVLCRQHTRLATPCGQLRVT